MARSPHDSHVLHISTSSGKLGLVKNQRAAWVDLRKRLAKPTPDHNHTLDQYLALPKDEQDRLKNTGFFVGGHCERGARKAQAIAERWTLSFDIDAATPEQIDSLKLGLSRICDFEFFAHTTRKHAPDVPRWRVVLPLKTPVPADKFAPLVRIVAAMMFRTEAELMKAVDDVSFRIAQVMYWPSTCRGAEFDTIHNPGGLLEPDSVLEGFGEWRDWTKLPYSEERSQKRPGNPKKKAEDPRTKRGIIGAFCRAYSVEDAVAKFIPEVYVPGDAYSSKPRYTLVGGSTSNGAIVEDGGLFLYSHHGTDPCSDRLVNAFDMVRLHLFGDQDSGKDEDASPTSLPSYKAMVEHVREDPAVLAEFNENFAERFDNLDEGVSLTDDEEDILGTLPKEKPSPLEMMNAQHAIARIAGKTVALTFKDDGAVDYSTITDLNTYYANFTMPSTRGEEPISAWWIKQVKRRTYANGVVFAPGRSPRGAYNLWTGFAVEADPNASCELFLAHIREVVCSGDEDQYNYVIGWLAHTIQRPEEKPGVALVLRGVKGAGKDTVGEYVGALFPNHHVKVANMEHLTGRFNAHQERALLLHVEEGFWSGDPRGVGVLNNLITSEIVAIERKGIDVIQVPSVVRLLLSSNADWVVPATAGERRYAVFNVEAKRAGDRPYFNAIYRERDSGGAAALLHYLQTFDLSDFDVRRPPQTEGLADQKLAGLKNIDGWWLDTTDAGQHRSAHGFEDETTSWQNDSITISTGDLYQSYSDWMHGRRHQGDLLSVIAFGRKIRAMCPSMSRRRLREGYGLSWGYKVPSLAKCRVEFEQWIGSKIPWTAVEESDEDDFSDLI